RGIPRGSPGGASAGENKSADVFLRSFRNRGYRNDARSGSPWPANARCSDCLMKAPFAIDPETGRVRFPDLSLELRPLMPEPEFIAATSKLNRDNLGANGGWQRYSIRELISEDRKLGLFFVFFHDRLKMLSFAYAQKDESWATWSEQSEREREKEYQTELAAQLAPENTFSWGRVNARLDSKSGGTDIWMGFFDPASGQI